MSEVAVEGKTEVPSMTIFWSFLNPRPVNGCWACSAVGGQWAFQGWRSWFFALVGGVVVEDAIAKLMRVDSRNCKRLSSRQRRRI